MRAIRTKPRPAFTLVELLVVLGIIVVLVGLTTAAVMRFRDTGPVAATKTNFSKIHSALTQQWNAVRDAADNDSARDQAYLSRALLKGASAANPEVKKEYVRLKLLQAFPRTFAEALVPNGDINLPAHPGYKKFLNDLGITIGNEPVPPEMQRAICLLMILEHGPKKGNLTADDLGTTCVERFVMTAVNAQAQGIVDGYRQPVVFTHSYNNRFGSLSILSAGRDKQFGVDGPAYNTFAVSNVQDATDNVLVP